MKNGPTLTAGDPPIGADRDRRASFAQERCWLVEQLHPGEPLATVAVAVKIEGALNAAALERTLGDIIERHPNLQTVCKRVNGRLHVEEVPSGAFQLEREAIEEKDFEQVSKEFARQRIDLQHAPLLRAKLVKIEEQRHVLLVAMHRTAGDLGILLRELSETCGQAKHTAAPTERDFVASAEGQKQLAFWKEVFKAPVLDLPTDGPRPPIQTFRAAVKHFEISETVAGKLRKFESHLPTTLLAAFQALLHRYTGQEDVVVGTNIGGIAVRTNLSGDPSVRELVERVRQSVSQSRSSSGVPFEAVLRFLGAERELSRPPLFGVAFEFEERPKSFEIGGVRFTPARLHHGTSGLDITLRLEEGGKALRGTLEYNTDLFTESRMARMAGHFQTILEAIAADPNQRISRLPILTPEEKRLVVEEWNHTETRYPRAKRIYDLFREQVKRAPDANAVVFEDRALTYRELDAWSNQLAARLQAEGVGPDTRVGVCVNRSLEMIVALVAIHKAGGAYVPMDPAYPQERLAFMLQDAETPVLVTEKGLAKLIPDTNAKAVFVDAFDPKAAVSEVESKATSDNLAYVIYTSGSTGKPKGVMVRHRNVVNFFTGMDGTIGSEPGVWLAVTSISFDISVLELFWTLTRGFKIVIQADGKQTREGYSIAEQIKRHEVTHFQCTPSMVTMLLEDPKTSEALKAVKKLFFGGEPMPPALIERLKGYGEVFNMYGPTETTIWSTVHPVTSSGGRITIGRPIANTDIYILDRNLQPCPIGVPGELWIGGDGVVRGYLNRPELTAERFISNPFTENPEDKIYRTGDLARFREDGEIEFLGRIDFQVKLRGFRIELGEIEAALRGHASVKECVMTVWQAGPNDQRLAAYLVPQPGARPQSIELRRFIKQKVPEYMVPSVFSILEALPLTPNGKIDRKALVPPDASRSATEGKFAPPTTPLEQRLARIFEEVLDLQPIGLTDNFFDFGGDMMATAEAQSRIEAECKTELSLLEFFQHPTVGGLAKILKDDPVVDICEVRNRAARQRQAFGFQTVTQVSI
jgi:amino acid adenylation domain-containing protein